MFNLKTVNDILAERYNEISAFEKLLKIDELELEKEEAKLHIWGHKECREYFKKCGLIKDDQVYHMHHKDTNLRSRNPERYNLWRLEDLTVLTASEHSKLHKKLRKIS